MIYLLTITAIYAVLFTAFGLWAYGPGRERIR